MIFAGFGIGNPWVFWTLRLLVLGVFIYAGYGISFGKRENENNYAWLAGIVYSLVEGLRWLRGADYPHYYNDIVTVFNRFSGAINERYTPDPELLYEGWINLFHATGLPFWVAFIIYSGLLIWAFMLIIKQFPKTAIWALPLFFVLTVEHTENLIRQYFAAVFVLFAFYFYFKENYKSMIAMLIIAPLIHYSSIMIEVPFVLLILITPSCDKLVESNVAVYLLVALFLYTYFLFDSSNFQYFAKFMSDNVDTVSDDKAAAYMSNADRWFTDEGSMSKILRGKAAGAIGIINQISRFLSYLFIVFFGFKTLKEDKRLLFAYAFTYIAILCKVGGGDIEMFNRFYNWYMLLMPLIMGRILMSKEINKDIRIVIAATFIIHFIWYGMINTIFSTSMFGYGFIWDANVKLF